MKGMEDGGWWMPVAVGERGRGGRETSIVPNIFKMINRKRGEN